MPKKATKKKAVTKKDLPLTKKQELFVLEFLKDLNAARAYKEVYKAAQKTAEVNGCKLLSNAKVKEEIDKQLKVRFANAGKDAQRVIDRLFELVDRCMQREPVMVRVGRQIVHKQEFYEDPETGEETLVGVWKFDSAGANKALESLGKYFKLFTEKHEHSGPNGEPLLPTRIIVDVGKQVP